MKKWLIFFAPKRIAPYITHDTSIAKPFIVNVLINLLASKIYTTPKIGDLYVPPMAEELVFGPYEIVTDALSPLLLAIAYHGLVRTILKVRGSLGRTTRLFYYAAVGYAICDLLLGVLLLLLPGNRILGLTGGAILSLYWLIVSTYLAKENYSISLRKALVLTLLIVLLAIILIFIIFSLWRGLGSY